MAVAIITGGLVLNAAYNSPAIDAKLWRLPYGGVYAVDTRGSVPGTAEADIDAILSSVGNGTAGRAYVCIIAESEWLNDVNIPYYSMRGNYPVGFISGDGCNPLYFDYVILGPIDDTWRKDRFIASRNMLTYFMSNFREIYASGDIRVYRRIY